MYKIAVVMEKGGVGKTTVALNLAVAAVQKGRKVAVIDIDQQATASKWTDRRTEEQPWVVPTRAAQVLPEDFVCHLIRHASAEPCVVVALCALVGSCYT